MRLWIFFLTLVSSYALADKELLVEGFEWRDFYQTYDPVSDSCSRFYEETIADQPTPDRIGDVIGYKPLGRTSLPLYIYLPGSFQPVDTEIARLHVKTMAERGYFAVAIRYPNARYPSSCDGTDPDPLRESMMDKARCLFEGSRSDSAVSRLCQLSDVDCDRDLLVHGFSQGGQIALMAKTFEPRFRKALIYGAGNFNLIAKKAYPCTEIQNNAFQPDDIRSLVGDQDIFFGGSNVLTSLANVNSRKNLRQHRVRTQQTAITGQPACPWYQGNCLNPNGSGYYIVRGFETENNCSNHGFFSHKAHNPTPCEGKYLRPDRGYVADKSETHRPLYPWSMALSFDWLTARD
ncbi:MAG: hypothetical protein HRU19_16160 [Pseudobacteriovorax sp.]|nr:hypothetical protein [Pseudobacteriovorax sp.]